MAFMLDDESIHSYVMIPILPNDSWPICWVPSKPFLLLLVMTQGTIGWIVKRIICLVEYIVSCDMIPNNLSSWADDETWELLLSSNERKQLRPLDWNISDALWVQILTKHAAQVPIGNIIKWARGEKGGAALGRVDT